MEYQEMLQAIEHLIIPRFEALDVRLDKIEGRLDKIEGRLDRLEERQDAMESRQIAMGRRLDSMALDIKVMKHSFENEIRYLKDGQSTIITVLGMRGVWPVMM